MVSVCVFLGAKTIYYGSNHCNILSIFSYVKKEVRTLEKSISSLGSINVRHEDSVHVTAW